VDLIFEVEPHVDDYLVKHGMSPVKVPFAAIGLGNKGILKGVAVWTNYHEGLDVTLTLAADFHPKMIRALPHVFAYAFDQLALPRVTAEIREPNRSSIRLAEWLGFRLEGRKRATDIRIYGLTRDDWMIRREQLFPSATA
jgi:hypothetical protein